MLNRKRGFGVIVLSLLAGLAAVLALIHSLQLFHLFPIYGPFNTKFFTYGLIGATLWGIVAAVWIWLMIGLWRKDPGTWWLLVILSSLNLVLAVVSMLGRSSLQTMISALVINGAILVYCLLSGTRESFAVE